MKRFVQDRLSSINFYTSYTIEVACEKGRKSSRESPTIPTNHMYLSHDVFRKRDHRRREATSINHFEPYRTKSFNSFHIILFLIFLPM